MKDLYRCLDEYPAEMLQAIAEVWRLRAPDGDAREELVRLGDGMLIPGATQRVVDGLSDDARRVLTEVQAAGGAVPAPRLTQSHGSIRRLGPAGMARERPWLHPANAIEELYYRGLIYRAYAEFDGRYSEMYFVPQQLYDALPVLRSGAPVVMLASAPPWVRDEGDALAEDLLAILARIRQRRIPAPEDDLPRGICPEALAHEAWVGRFLGETAPLRLGFLWTLLRRLRLVQVRGGFLQPSLRARDWLRLPDEQRRGRLWAAWYDDLGWDEVRLLPELEVQELAATHSPAMVRRRLLGLLVELPVGRWLSSSSFVQLVQVRYADLLRSGGSLEWEIHDAASGDDLTGPTSWPLVEGRLIKFVTLTMLRWLGAVKTGGDNGLSEADAFLITDRGHRLLTERVPIEGPAAPMPSKEAPLARLDDDLTVSITTHDSAYERYQLERFAEWRGQSDESASYEITADSVWRSQNAGVKAEQMLAFLGRVSGDRVPLAVIGALRAWAGRYGLATVRRAAILETVDQHTMEQITAHQEMAALLGQAITPTVRLVDEENIEALIHLLKEAGIWPRVRV